VPDQVNAIHEIISILEVSELNVHSIMLKHDGQILNLTAPRNIILG
jgi:hypothetical protein